MVWKESIMFSQRMRLRSRLNYQGRHILPAFGITSKGNFEDKNIPNLLHILGRDLTSPVDEKTLQKGLRLPFAGQNSTRTTKYSLPGTALAIAAFAKAGRVLARLIILNKPKMPAFLSKSIYRMLLAGFMSGGVTAKPHLTVSWMITHFTVTHYWNFTKALSMFPILKSANNGTKND